MDFKNSSIQKRRPLNSQDLKRRLYEKGGIHGNSMPSLKNTLNIQRTPVLYVNLNSSLNKNQNSKSPKVLKKTASAFGGTQHKKSFINKISSTSQNFHIKKRSNRKVEQNFSPSSKTAMNFYKQRSDTQQQQIQFNSSFYKADSNQKQAQHKLTKRLMQKLSGLSPAAKSQSKREANNQSESAKSKYSKDEIIQKQVIESKLQVSSIKKKKQGSSLQQYIKLVVNNVPNIDQFLYLIKSNSKDHPQNHQADQNIYQLNIIDYQEIRQLDKQDNFQYYTISKKGFCHYANGKPCQFIDLTEWLQEKQIYQKIKKLNFFNRFRRWKTIKMWIKKVVRHRMQKCSQSLDEKLFILNPLVRNCILQIKMINLQMQSSLSIISRNEGSYSLQSFKHCQQKTRRQAAGIVEEFSRRSRKSVKKCFEINLQNLKELLKTKDVTQDKNLSGASHNPKDNAFQVLGFPSKMSYQHRSKLRKLTGRFVRFSYLVDIMHLNGLANIFKSQIQSFSEKLKTSQLQSEVSVVYNGENKREIDQKQRQKMFNIQLLFKPIQISPSQIQQQRMNPFELSIKIQKAHQCFNPLYHIKQKSLISTNKQLPENINQQANTVYRNYVPYICDLWISLNPTFDNIYDQLSFLIKQSMTSLKYFQRWSKHRQMQKYVNILEEWDDIVSDNWEISQNDNLDPISIIDNIQISMAKIKQMIQVSQNKLTQRIINQITQSLNVYWENSLINVNKLIDGTRIQNNAQMIEFYLAYMSQHIQNFNQKIPQIIELGIFTINLSKMKLQAIQFMKAIFQDFKSKLPAYVEENANQLNVWINQKSIRLRQQIHTIDDFVRINKSLKQIQSELFQKKDLCHDLGHVYQTMYNFKIQAKKRKQFETTTLKSKQVLQQLLINSEQTIQRKTQFYTREVTRYHLPNLLKQIQKISDKIGSSQFESLKSESTEVIKKLTEIQEEYLALKVIKDKCLEYLKVLKLMQVDVKELDELEKQIQSRLIMWQNLTVFEQFINKIDHDVVNQMDLQKIRLFVEEKNQIVKYLDLTHNNPNNQVLQHLKQKVQTYFVNIPLLQGFNDRLSQSHWEQINEILKEYPNLDLRRKQFTLKTFIDTEIGKQSKKIEFIFNKAKVENELQAGYSQIENVWQNTLAKSKIESRFQLISNPEAIRQAFDYMLRTLCDILSNPFSQTLKQYSITYDLLIGYFNSFESWMKIQQKLVKIDSQCKLLDVKKILDYASFQNSQKIFKNIMKTFSTNRNDAGVKMSKLFVNGLDEKLDEIHQNLNKVQQNIRVTIEQHRRNFPPFYLLNDNQLFKIITEQNNLAVIQTAAKSLFDCIDSLEFQGERISGIINVDKQKMHKNMISANTDIQQILLQISDTIIDINKKNMKSCRYKAVQSGMIKLIPLYQSQYLLAINKVDFSNYTQISIDNQSQVMDSLKQFYKVMKKDITDDLKLRDVIKSQHRFRYDALILQSLYHQQIVSHLIRMNVSRVNDFEWQKILRFTWDENNNEENNITIKQAHYKLKYGNQYIGSRAQVIMSSDVNMLASANFVQKSLYLGSFYNLQRYFNFLGHKVVNYICQTSTSSKQINYFILGHWYLQSICFFQQIDYLNKVIKKHLLQGNPFVCMKENLLKKNLYNLKQNDKKQTAVFMSVSHPNQRFNFADHLRIINYQGLPNINQVTNILKVKNIFNNEQISQFIIRLFQMVNYLQEKSQLFNCSFQAFIQKHLNIDKIYTKHQILQEFEKYIKPFMGIQNLMILSDNVNIFLSSAEQLDYIQQEPNQKSQRNKQKKGSSSHTKREGQSRKGTKSSKKIQPHLQKQPEHKRQVIKTSKLLDGQGQQMDQKIGDLKEALQVRNIVIVSGAGNSKKYLISQLSCSQQYVLHQIYPFVQQSEANYKLLQHEIQCIASNRQITATHLLYIEGVNFEVLKELELILYYKQEVLSKLKQNNIFIVLAADTLAHLDYNVISPFFTIHIQLNFKYLVSVANKWFDLHFTSIQLDLNFDKKKCNQKANFMKFVNETVLNTFQNWSIKDIKHKEYLFDLFLVYLKSLLPVNKLLEAMTYCFIRLFPNMDNDYIKLQFLVKKLLGQEIIEQQSKVYNLIYVPDKTADKLVNVKKYVESLQTQNIQKKYNFQYVITPQLFHYEFIMKNILSKTDHGVYICGENKSGKTSLFSIFKHNNNNCNSFIRLTMNQTTNKQTFINRIFSNLGICSSTEIKSKLNYQKSIIMIDDINMKTSQEQTSNKSIHGNIQQKLNYIVQLMKYKVLEYPSAYRSINGQTHHKMPKISSFDKKMFKVSHVKFIFAGKQQHNLLKQLTVPIEIQSNQNTIKSIFTQYLKERVSSYDEMHQQLVLNDIVQTTLEICKKVSQINSELDGLQLSKTKYILSKFNQIKIKDTSALNNNSNGVVRQFHKYWAYILKEQLGFYDRSLSDSIIDKELRHLNLFDTKEQLCYSYLHIKDGGYSKKVEYVKDIKKVFNIINEKIDKYNQSDNQRYGPSFQFINFDQLIHKIVKLSNNLSRKDYIIVGRKGSGKQSLIRLVSYLQGSNYKQILTDLKAAVMDLFLSTNVTTVSSYIITKKLESIKQIEELRQFYYTDFEAQILGSKQIQKPIKISIKQRQRAQLSATVKGTLGKGLTATSFLGQDYYLSPKSRFTQEDVIRYRDAVRIVILVDKAQIFRSIPIDIQMNFIIDQIEQIPMESLCQYNIKLLDVDQITYNKAMPLLIAQIFNYEKQKLHLSLKMNDDSTRLFSSFSLSLGQQMKQEQYKYGKIIELYNQVNTVNTKLQTDVIKLHSDIKQLTDKISVEQTQQLNNRKEQCEQQLQQMSSNLNKSQKVLEMLEQLIPTFKEKHSGINIFVNQKQYFQQCLAVAACYFTFLSQRPFSQRRKVLKTWFNNPKIPFLEQSVPIQSFLRLFNLYQKQFNAQPMDDLQDFYENMAIVFNSVKPIIIDDSCKKGKQWLQKVCSFVSVSQKELNFMQVIGQNLSKPSNILIQITDQQTMNTLNNNSNFVYSLLYLSENTQTMNIKGQDINVSPQAKFYVLLGPGIITPHHIKNQFTIVCFGQSQNLLQKSLQQVYMSICHPDNIFSQLQLKKKIRNLKLQRQSLMIQIAETIYVPFDENQDQQQSSQKNVKSDQQPKKQHKVPFQGKDLQYFQNCICDIADKTITRGQTLSNKLKQKHCLFTEFESKHNSNIKFIEQTKKFIHKAKQILQILNLMTEKSNLIHPQYSYLRITNQEFVQKIKIGLKKGFMKDDNISMFIYAIKMWGPQYLYHDSLIFTLLVVTKIQNIFIKDVTQYVERIHSTKKPQKTTKQLEFMTKILNQQYSSTKQLQQNLLFHLQIILRQLSPSQLLIYLQTLNSIGLTQGQQKKTTLHFVWSQMQSSTKLQAQHMGYSQNTKIVHFDLKDVPNIEHQMKKLIQDQNIFVVNSLSVLEVLLDALKRLGSNQKKIYYHVKGMQTYQAQIQGIIDLKKKFNINCQLYNTDYRHNNLLYVCLKKLSLQKQSKPIPSVQKIKSIGSITSKNVQQKVEQLSQIEQMMVKNGSSRPNITQKELLQNKNDLQQNVQKIQRFIKYMFLSLNKVYYKFNRNPPQVSKQEVKELATYFNFWMASEQPDCSFNQKIQLIFRVVELIKKQEYLPLDLQLHKSLQTLQLEINAQVKLNKQRQSLIDKIIQKCQKYFIIQSSKPNILLLTKDQVQRTTYSAGFLRDLKIFLEIVDYEDSQKFNSVYQKLILDIKNVYSSIKNGTNIQASIKRTSRKSLNVFFKKDELKEKLITPSKNLMPLNQKPGMRRVSRNAVSLQKHKETLSTSQKKDLQKESSNELYFEVQIRKWEVKINYLTRKINEAVSTIVKQRNNNFLNIETELTLGLMILQHQIPGTWHSILQTAGLTNNLFQIFSKVMKTQEDMSFLYEKVKRSKQFQMQFRFIKYCKEYIQSHFHTKLSIKAKQIFMITNCPSNQELENSLGYLTISGYGYNGWKFINQGLVQLVSANEKIPEQSKVLHIIRKNSLPALNIVALDVFQTKSSGKALFRVYGNCKKNTNMNTGLNNPSIYLKEESQI